MLSKNITHPGTKVPGLIFLLSSDTRHVRDKIKNSKLFSRGVGCRVWVGYL